MHLAMNGKLSMFALCVRWALCVEGLNMGSYSCQCWYPELYCLFGQDEQNSNTGLLKVFAPATK